MIDREFHVRSYSLPKFRFLDKYIGPVKPFIGNAAWYASSGRFPCSNRLGANNFSTPVRQFYSDVANLDNFYQGNFTYLKYVAEGAGGVWQKLQANPAFRKYAACDLPIIRLSRNTQMVSSLEEAIVVMKGVFSTKKSKRDFIDVILDGVDNSPVLETGTSSTTQVVPENEDVTTIFYSPNKVTFRVRAQSSSWLVFTDAYDPRWSATVDGQEAQVHKANIAFKAVRVPTGEHTVTFRFGKSYQGFVIWFMFLTIISSLFLLLGLAIREAFNPPANKWLWK